jgi:hypothetical protein
MSRLESLEERREEEIWTRNGNARPGRHIPNFGEVTLWKKHMSKGYFNSFLGRLELFKKA